MRGKDSLYVVLRQRVVAGFYSPGTQLKEEPLAREFGLSRTPVRSALKLLIDDGLATAEGGQGVRVTTWSDHDVEDSFQLRLLLEPHTAALAAVRGGDPMVTILRQSNVEMAEAIRQENIQRIQDENRLFHLTLLEYCGSPRLRTILQNMIDIPMIVRSFYLANEDDLKQSLRHHEEITAAAIDANGDAARHAMQLHLSVSFKRFLRHRATFRDQGFVRA
mgnify:FL=1